MYDYNTRLADKYNRTVVSLAVLADDDPEWRPDHYEEELWGWSVRMRWPPVKLLDYANRVAELEQSKNPFACVVLAHLKTLETRDDPEERRVWKFRLVRGLYERGLSKENVRQLMRLIDWLMELPPRAQRRYRQELHEYEEGRRMPFYTGMERGAMRKVIDDLLRWKFGEEAMELMEVLDEIDDGEKYLALNRVIVSAKTLDEVRRACAKAAAQVRRRKKSGQ